MLQSVALVPLLQSHKDQVEKTVAFVSSTFTDAEQNDSIVEKALMCLDNRKMEDITVGETDYLVD